MRKRVNTSPKLRALAYVIVYVGVGAIVLLLGAGVAQLRQLAQDNARSIALIEDCTATGGTCYKRSQANTERVVTVLNEFRFYTVACADKPGTQSVARIRACAIKEARKEHHHER